MFGLDVNGYDNTPEWGYCKQLGCRNEAMPIWLVGDYPDDPDLLLCPTHLGSILNSAFVLLEACHNRLDALGSYGDMDTTIELWRRVGSFLQDMRP